MNDRKIRQFLAKLLMPSQSAKSRARMSVHPFSRTFTPPQHRGMSKLFPIQTQMNRVPREATRKTDQLRTNGRRCCTNSRTETTCCSTSLQNYARYVRTPPSHTAPYAPLTEGRCTLQNSKCTRQLLSHFSLYCKKHGFFQNKRFARCRYNAQPAAT